MYLEKGSGSRDIRRPLLSWGVSIPCKLLITQQMTSKRYLGRARRPMGPNGTPATDMGPVRSKIYSTRRIWLQSPSSMQCSRQLGGGGGFKSRNCEVVRRRSAKRVPSGKKGPIFPAYIPADRLTHWQHGPSFGLTNRCSCTPRGAARAAHWLAQVASGTIGRPLVASAAELSLCTASHNNLD